MRTPRGEAMGTNAPGGWKRLVPMMEIGTTRTCGEARSLENKWPR